ncbi:MAG TPA: hypothetical protein VGE07_20980, partial [Herpetosiphonaceae bacterium]
DSLPYTEEQLQQSAAAFEDQAWPALAGLYGERAEPGQQITVLNARIPGLGGYYSADNELPRELNSYSNQRPMIFINTDSRPPGSDGYVSVLAHETQHLLHRRVLGHPAIWFNEGGSMLTEHLSGFGDDSLAGTYLIDPDVQLNDWSALSGSPNSHYGAAELFLRYLNDQLPDGLPLGELAGRDAGDETQTLVDAIRRRHPDIQSFSDLYATWAVANLINDPQLADGRYAYQSLPQTVEPVGALPSDETGLVRQLGADYLEWQPAATQRTIVFSGAATVPVLGAGVPPGGGGRFWWGGRGDSRISTLSAALRVPEGGASLRFDAWHDIEQDYDYAYLTLSEDGGATWQPLAIPASEPGNPLGLNLGQGVTGQSGGWREQQADLGRWAGKEISLRFWLVNDEAYNTPGLALAGLRVDGAAPLDWQGAGFVEIANRLPQEWELRGVVFAPGQPPSVEEIPVAAGQARWTIPAGARAVLVVSGATAATTEPARYAYRAE